MTYNEDWLEEFPYWTLGEAVATPTEEFPDAWRSFWGIGADCAPDHLDPDKWDVANEMHDVARRICHAASNLSSVSLPDSLRTLPAWLEAEARREELSRRELVARLKEELPAEQLASQDWKDVLYFLRFTEGEEEGKAKLFRTALEIYAYPEFGCSPAEVAQRLLELLEYLIRSKGTRTREYLRRVATCYVRNMRPELAVMSRAVMESALQLPEVEARIEKVLEAKQKRYATLAEWIDAATAEGVLTTEARMAADRVKLAGDDAIHSFPQQAPPTREVLEDLQVVLRAVERFEKDGRSG